MLDWIEEHQHDLFAALGLFLFLTLGPGVLFPEIWEYAESLIHFGQEIPVAHAREYTILERMYFGVVALAGLGQFFISLRKVRKKR